MSQHTMSTFHTATPNDIAWWPESGKDQTAVWFDGAGTVQPALEFNFDPLDNIDWDTGAILYPPNGGDPAYPTTYNQTTSPWPTATPSRRSNYVLWRGLVFTPPKALTEADTVASTPSDTSWAGFVPVPTEPVAGPSGSCVPTSSFAAHAAPSQAELAWFEHTFSSPVTTMPCHSWGPAASSASAYAVPDVGDARTMSGTYMPSPPTVLGKRRLEVADGPCKRVKEDVNGVLEAAAPTSRARQKPYTRTPECFNSKFEAAGRGAGMLAALNAQEVYYRVIPGPSVHKDSMGTTAQEKSSFVEGSEREVTGHHASGVMQQPEAVDRAEDAEPEGAERAQCRIPRRLDTRQRSLLKVTSADWASGTVDEPKCRLCPGAAFSNWDDYKRHCATMEAHPDRLYFCETCGDFFARSDSLKRHRKNPPPECRGVKPEEAEAKRKETERLHAEFEDELERCLRTDGKIVKPFARLVKEKYPNSSKRASRQQSRRPKETKPRS